MFTAILFFLKEKLFSTAGTFLLIFVVTLSVFLFYNKDSILERFGFETAATVKTDLANSQKDLQTAKIINDNAQEVIKELEDRHTKEITVLKDYAQEKEVSVKKVEVSKDTLLKKSAPIKKRLEEKMVTTTDAITIPTKEYNELSQQNIQAINSAFKSLQLQPAV